MYRIYNTKVTRKTPNLDELDCFTKVYFLNRKFPFLNISTMIDYDFSLLFQHYLSTLQLGNSSKCFIICASSLIIDSSGSGHITSIV